MSDKKKHQPALSVEAQIDNLRKIGLTIENEEYAKAILNDISYFRLIKAYSLGLKPKNGNYYDGVTFEQIVELYLFNANFRQLLFAEIEQIEINLRCRIANYHSSKRGIFGYIDPTFFKSAKYHADTLKEINKEIRRNSKAPFIKNFKENYDPPEIPMYAAVEVFSLGTLSKFFKNMVSEDKKAIAKTYGVTYTYLESWFESIAYVRNICAHYGRLYNAKLSKTPQMYREYSNKGISSIRIFGILCCMKHILPNDQHWRDFVQSIQDLFFKYPAVDRKSMGFPDDWMMVLLDC